MEKIKSRCNSICKTSKIKYLKRSKERKISSNKEFWNFIKPFLTNKGCTSNDFVSIRNGDAFIDKESSSGKWSNLGQLNKKFETNFL